ncbi:MAG: hypothetical protein HY611_10315 [Elusimicrobia bacterium]|nr:hypothetical protein [Elusimicrobiota bacterium]
MKKVAFLTAAAMVLAVAGCGGAKSVVKKGEIERSIDQQTDRGRYFEVIGIGGADPSLTNKTQRMSLSRDAAIVKAQFELLTIIRGVEVEGGIKIVDALSKDSTLEARLDEVIKGAEPVKTDWTSDDGCVVTLRLDKSKVEEIVGKKVK